jgi:nucleotide-binding universal stress UspA family protein
MDGPIIVGTDGSETATKAVEEAVKLAAALGRPLHIVTAYKPLGSASSGVPAEFAIQADSAAQAALDDASSRARIGGVTPSVHSRTGDAAEVILDIAEEVDASVIVVGNKGIDSVKRFVLGNVPSKVVHHAPCSTFVVHTR